MDRRISAFILCSLFLIPGPISAQDAWNISKTGELYQFWGDTKDVVIVGQYAYTTEDGLGIRILDISQPANPVEIGLHKLQVTSRCLAATNTHLFVACYDSCLRSFDISQPDQLT